MWPRLSIVLLLATHLGCGSAPARSIAAHEGAVEPVAEPQESSAHAAWSEGMPELIEATSLEFMLDDEIEVQLNPFVFDPELVQSTRYDTCLAAGACPAREFAQPNAVSVAVGMSWEAAGVFCETRGLSVQRSTQDIAIQDTLHAGTDERTEHLPDVDPTQIVSFGFRCTQDRP